MTPKCFNKPGIALIALLSLFLPGTAAALRAQPQDQAKPGYTMAEYNAEFHASSLRVSVLLGCL